MSLYRLSLILIAAATLMVSSCRKNYAEEQYIPTTDPIKPDLTVKITGSVAGFVNDENNKPVAGAVVKAGDKQTTTDEYGYFKIAGAQLPKLAAFVKVSKDGLFDAFRTFTAATGKENFVRLKMLAKVSAGTINATAGGSVTVSGATVQLPANGVVVAANGSAYTGQVQVNARPVDMTSTSDFQLSAPGDGRAVDADGHLTLLQSVSAIAVELTGSGGEKLQVAAGNKATLTLPIPSALQASAPQSIALWYFDETNGFWKQEASAQKSGNAYVGTVSHFSFWDGATGIPLVNFTARVLNTSLQPLANVPVVINIAGMPTNAGYGRFGYTDANGDVTGAIPANSNLILDVMTTCANSAYSHAFTTGSSSVDLGVLTGNLGQAMVTITGTATNCSGQPVTDGYVQTYDHGFYNRIAITNGSFSFSGLVCSNTTANYVVVDNTTHQQSSPQSVTLVPGVNNLGALSACGTSSLGFINYTLNGTPYSITEPSATLAGYNLSPNPWTAIIHLNSSPSPDMNFQFDGGTALGSGHKVTDIWSPGFPSGRGYAPVPLTVTITEYGDIGGFISGSFSGLTLDFVSNAIYNVNYNFRIKRFN